MSSDKPSVFLAEGQLRKSEASQEMLDAWNRNSGYYDSGTPKYDDWKNADIVNRTLMKPDAGTGGLKYVDYNGRKYVLKPGIELVDG